LIFYRISIDLNLKMIIQLCYQFPNYVIHIVGDYLTVKENSEEVVIDMNIVTIWIDTLAIEDCLEYFQYT